MVGLGGQPLYRARAIAAAAAAVLSPRPIKWMFFCIGILDEGETPFGFGAYRFLVPLSLTTSLMHEVILHLGEFLLGCRFFLKCFTPRVFKTCSVHEDNSSILLVCLFI